MIVIFNNLQIQWLFQILSNVIQDIWSVCIDRLGWFSQLYCGTGIKCPEQCPLRSLAEVILHVSSSNGHLPAPYSRWIGKTGPKT